MPRITRGDIRFSIAGIQEVQAANLRAIHSISPQGSLGQATRHGLAGAHRYLTAITHVDTGAYRASHRMQYHASGPWGEIFVDPAATNPRTGRKVRSYAKYEEERGGSHAAYERTVTEAGPEILRQMAAIVGDGFEGSYR